MQFHVASPLPDVPHEAMTGQPRRFLVDSDAPVAHRVALRCLDPAIKGPIREGPRLDARARARDRS